MVRFKHRYLVATVAAGPGQGAEAVEAKEILAILKESIATSFGDFGTGSTASALQVRSFDADSGVCVIRAGRDSHRMVRASLSLLAGSNRPRFSISVEGVAGCDRTLNAAVMEACARGYRRAGFNEETASILLQRQRELLDMPLR